MIVPYKARFFPIIFLTLIYLTSPSEACVVSGYDKNGKKYTMLFKPEQDKEGAVAKFKERHPQFIKKITVEGECNTTSNLNENKSTVINTKKSESDQIVDILTPTLDKINSGELDTNDPMSVLRFLEEGRKVVTKLCDVGDTDPKKTNDIKRKNLSYPWKVEARGLQNSRITLIQQIGRNECDESAKFSITYAYRGSSTTTENIACGVNLPKYIKSSFFEAKCF